MSCEFRNSRLWRWLPALASCRCRQSASPAFECQLSKVFECTADAGCTKTTAQDRDLPATVTLDVKQKNLFSGLFGGEGMLESGDVYEDDKVLILHGRRALQTWTAVVSKETGAYSGSVSQLGKTFAEFGTCTGKRPGVALEREGTERAGPRPAFSLRATPAVSCGAR